MEKRIWFVVEGGIGKHVTFSAIIHKLCIKYNVKQINVISAYSDLYEYNPHVRESATPNTHGLYDRIKENKDIVVYREPYYSSFINGDQHIIESWCDLYGLEYDSDLPDINLSPDLFNKHKKNFLEKVKGDFIIVQFGGGQSPFAYESNKQTNLLNNYNSQIKNYPRVLAQKVVDEIKCCHEDLDIVNFSLPNEEYYQLEHVTNVTLPYIMYSELIKFSKGYIAVDSALQHFSGDKKNLKKGVVLWGSTGHHQFGYKKNINISNDLFNDDEKHNMLPLCKPCGDIFDKDGKRYKHKSLRLMDIDTGLVMSALEESIKYNKKVKHGIPI